MWHPTKTLESVFILSVHLADGSSDKPWVNFLARPQQKFNRKLEQFIQGRFKKCIALCLKYPAASISVFISLLLITIGGVAGGMLGFSFTPSIESDTVIAQATLTYGSPKAESVEIQKRIVDAAYHVLKENNMEIGCRLGQVSEFSFLIAILAFEQNIICSEVAYMIQLCTLITFIGSTYYVVLTYPTPIAITDQLRRS